MRIFVDTNVLLDVLVQRTPHFDKSATLWLLAESGRLHASVAAISFSNCWFIVRRLAGKTAADKAMRGLRDVFSPVDLTQKILNQAIDAGFTDFEDAIQFHSAIAARSDYLVTRNQDHFPRTAMPVLSPAEFLTANSFE